MGDEWLEQTTSISRVADDDDDDDVKSESEEDR